MFHAPVCFVLWQLGTLACGAIMYDETQGFGPQQWVLGGVGTACVTLGVAVSATRPFPNSPGYMILEPLFVDDDSDAPPLMVRTEQLAVTT